MSNANNEPKGAQAAVFVESIDMPEDSVLIQGPDFNKPISLLDLLSSYNTMGFQASSLGEAIDIVEKMVNNIYIIFFFLVLFISRFY